MAGRKKFPANVAPLVSDVAIKLMFATLLCSCGLLHLRRIGEIIDYHGISSTALPFDSTAGFSADLLGSLTVASSTGVGGDVMAFTSVVGIDTKLLARTVQPGTFETWLAAPVPATLEHSMELFRSSGKIFRDDNELFSEPSWIAVMEGQGIVLRQKLLTRAPWVPRRLCYTGMGGELKDAGYHTDAEFQRIKQRILGSHFQAGTGCPAAVACRRGRATDRGWMTALSSSARIDLRLQGEQ